MGKLPAFQFYPADWLTDAVSGCSLAAQGLWLRMMIVMHSAERRGYLVMNGRPMPDEFIAAKCGCGVETYRSLLDELSRAGVPRRASDEIIFNKRMVEDERKRSNYSSGNRDKGAVKAQRATQINTQIEGKSTRKRSEDEEEVRTAVMNLKLEIEDFDGQEKFMEFCHLYSRSDESAQAQMAFVQAVESIVKARKCQRLEALEWLVSRTRLYLKLTPTRLHKNMFDYLDKRLFNQSEEVWRASGDSNRGSEKLNQRVDAGRKALQILRAADVVDGNVRPQLERGEDR
jgi:hypothetical protein